MDLRKLFKRTIVLLFMAAIYLSSFAQNHAVSGLITDIGGETMVGVNIKEKGVPTNGAISDIDGKFSISGLNENSTLVFSFIGYVTYEIKVGNQRTVSVVMKEDMQALDEVVVVGYGTMKRRDLTGSVASVSGKEIATAPVANALQALQGKLPGVNIITQDGRPDASVSVRVRGGGSISQSNEPLFLVDGFPVSSINDIPADLIESIDVLKDASSTAIYGARGANGVIIITTKTPKGDRLTINYNSYVKFNTPAKYLETMDAYDYVAYNWAYADAIGSTYRDAWERLWAIGNQTSFTSASGASYSNPGGIDHYKNVNARNITKDVYTNSLSHSHNLSMSGGSGNTRFVLAANYMDDQGLKINSWFKRANVSFKLNQKLHKKLDFNVDARYSNMQRVVGESTSNGTGSILSSAYRFRPIAATDVLGELDDRYNTMLGMYDQILQDRFDPVARTQDYKPHRLVQNLRANTSLNWKILKNLTARSELGLSTYWNKTKTWYGPIYQNYFDADGNQTYGGNADIERSDGWGLRWANTLNYDVPGLGKRHTLNILAGQEISDSGSENMKITAQYFPISFDAERAFAMMDQYNKDMLTPNHTLTSSIGTPDRMQSYFGRANYALLDRYLLTLTFRADGSSKFASTHRWGYFPAAAVAWRASEEAFLQNAEWLSNLKFRLSYGEVGNDGISANLWRMNWKSSGLLNYSIDEVKQPGYEPASSTMSNPNLKWETTVTRDFGLDFGFLKSRLFGTIDLYWNTTRDLLMLTPISSISGFTSTYDNVGQTSNKGLEIALSGVVIENKDFSLRMGMNFNMNKGNVDKLAEGINGLYKTEWGSTMTQPNTGDYILKEGYPVGMVRGYTYDGWYTTADFNYANGVYTLKSGIPDVASGVIGPLFGIGNSERPSGQVAYPGVIKYKDTSGPDGVPDGIIDENDVTIIGDMNPKHTGGFNLSATYKRLDLSLGFNWSYGNKVYNANRLAALYGSKNDGLYRNRLTDLSTAYKIYDIKNGQLARVTTPAELDALNANATLYLPYHENPVVSSLGIEDGSFLRLNTFSLGYSLPKPVLKKVGINNIRLYATIYNLLTLTGYSGIDPEVNTNTAQGGAVYPTTGLDWGAYPRARSFTFGINVNF
ncbi:MAG: TonB-dependent receptor [Candidatus Symbiothrix sp.]|jgi:TonB-linked SusC/RagA family outer membrane protein|nr:TonB-dependent receptor [Candidatus Symbiothrix sp.]